MINRSLHCALVSRQTKWLPQNDDYVIYDHENEFFSDERCYHVLQALMTTEICENNNKVLIPIKIKLII